MCVTALFPGLLKTKNCTLSITQENLPSILTSDLRESYLKFESRYTL